MEILSVLLLICIAFFVMIMVVGLIWIIVPFILIMIWKLIKKIRIGSTDGIY